jgi:hypothetical protein
MLGHGFAHSNAPVRRVKEVQFGILSPEEIVSSFFSVPLHVTEFVATL